MLEDMVPARAAPLPDLYGRWLTELLDADVPTETRATCDRCVMCDVASPWRPDVKCCVYMPAFPNFLVGQILFDPDPRMAHGQRTVRERMRARATLTPLGLGRPAAYAASYERTIGAMGHSVALRCPHFRVETGDCGVWKHRDHTCATYFCRNDRGELGARFWSMVRRWLKAIERDLALWCLEVLDVDVASVAALLLRRPDGVQSAAELEGIVSPGAYAELWGAWAGREEAFYMACAERVRALAWSEVVSHCGPEVRALGRLVTRARDRLDEPIPDRLRPATYQISAHAGDWMEVITHSSTDPLVLPSALVAVLHHFDGSPLREVQEAISQQLGAPLEAELVGRLVDHGMLRGVPDPG